MFEAAIDILRFQSLEAFLANFWFILFVEVPRYLLGAVAIAYPVLSMHYSKRSRADEVTQYYSVSVVVPAHNDANSLTKTVLSLREQINVVVQIIVVNDGSTDHTHSVCKELIARGLIDDYIYVRSRGGKAAAVNAALEKAEHAFFMVTDSDTTFDRDALRNACSFMDDPEVAGVSGNIRVRNVEHNLATRVQQINYMYSITLGRMVKDMLGFYYVVSGAFGLFRTEQVRTIGGWDFGPGEDGDISTRLRLAGWKIRFAPFAVAMTDVPDSFVRLARQRLRWDRSMIRVRWRKYRATVLNPLRNNFKPMFALSFLDIYLFQGLVPFLFVYYIVELIYRYGLFALTIILTVQFLYLGLGLIKFALALAVSPDRRSDLKLFAYVPLYSLVNIYFLRMVKLYATVNELILRGSYTDAYVPKKVRDRIHRY